MKLGCEAFDNLKSVSYYISLDVLCLVSFDLQHQKGEGDKSRDETSYTDEIHLRSSRKGDDGIDKDEASKV